MNCRKSLLALSVASIIGSNTAIAAEEAQAEKAKNDYEVIVVTQKRTQTLQEVPVAVNAYGADFIEDFNVTNAVDLAKFTPGLNGGSENDSYIDSIGIRGITTSDYGIGGDASIGLYLDGVYQGRSGGSLSSFFDMSRVEVAKGPQGTLFGRNAASGAISMYTNEAVDGTEGSVELGVGSDSMQEATAVFNTNITDDAFIRIAGYHLTQDSFIDNTEGDMRDKEVNALRVNFTYDGWTDSQLKLSLNYEDRDMDGGIYRSVWNDTDKRTISSDLAEDGKDVAEVFGATLDFTHDFGGVTFMSQTAMKNNTWDYLEDYDGTAMSLGDYAQKDDNEYVSQEFRITSNNDSSVFWFVGVSAYQEKVNAEFYNGYNEDQFCAQLPNLEEWDIPMTEHTSQPVDYYADCNELYIDDEWVDITDPDVIEGVDYPAPGDGDYYSKEQIFARGTNTGYGIYGDLTWSVTSATDITLGGRFSYDKKEFALRLPDPDSWLGHYWLVGGHTDDQWIEGEQDWSEFTPRAAVNHKLNDDMNVYASYSRGYKAGGFNTFAFDIAFEDWTGWDDSDPDEENHWYDETPDGIIDEIDEDYWSDVLYGGVMPAGTTLASYDPEIVDSFELGLKGDFFDDAVKLNVAVYYYDYQDFQGLFAANGGSVIKNIGQAEGKGIELDVTFTPTDDLRLYLATAYQNSEVVEGEDLDGTSIVGKKLAAPELTASFVGSYFLTLGDVDMTAQVSYSWQSETYGDEFMGGADIYAQESYGLLGMQVNAELENWKISMYVDNLTDEEYFDSGINDTGINHFGIGRGVNGGISAKYSF
ncbi:MAG: TonB-dependent receptor [Colwellia sp.]